jgi:hypothetical protein
MSEQEQTTKRGPGRPARPASAKPEREYLGTFDIRAGMPDGLFDQPDPGLDDAQWEASVGFRQQTGIDAATPPARPGYVQRWVRHRLPDGTPDQANVAEAIRMGYTMRSADSLPGNGIAYPVYDDGRGNGILAYNELVLYEIPVHKAEHYQKLRRQQEEGYNKSIYQEASSLGAGVNRRHGSMTPEFGDGPRSAAGLIE